MILLFGLVSQHPQHQHQHHLHHLHHNDHHQLNKQQRQHQHQQQQQQQQQRHQPQKQSLVRRQRPRPCSSRWKIQWLLLLFITTTTITTLRTTTLNTIMVVQALCEVQDQHHEPVSLVDNQVLPPGVKYNAVLDRLECFDVGDGCRRWTVSNCKTVNCVGARACQEAILRHNDAVNCRGVAACQHAQLTDVHSIVCVGRSRTTALLYDNTNNNMNNNNINDMNNYNMNNNDMNNNMNNNNQNNEIATDLTTPCQGTTIQTNYHVLCLGENACGTPFTATPTIVHLEKGGDGTIRCMGGRGRTTCQNLLVHVHHARRACLTTPYESQEQQEHCAVVCEDKETDCRVSTIQFQVDN